MADMQIPTPDILRQLLTYEPLTGRLLWRERAVTMFPDLRSCALWNSKYAGKAAFSVPTKRGYLSGKIFNRMYLAHRVIWAMTSGDWPEQVDHINGVRTDNRLENLRSVTAVENQRNMKRSSRNTSGITGVHYDARTKRWNAFISADKQQKLLGRFERFEDAVEMRRSWELKLGYHENHGR